MNNKNNSPYPPCVLYFCKIQKQFPFARPVLGIYASDIDSASIFFIENMRRGLFARLQYATHVVAEVNGELLDEFPNMSKSNFFSDSDIIDFLTKKYS